MQLDSSKPVRRRLKRNDAPDNIKVAQQDDQE